MCAEPAAAITKISAGLRHSPRSDAKRLRFRRDVEHPYHLPILQAFICCGLADGDHEIPPCLSSIRSRSAIVVMVNAGSSGGTRPQSLLRKLAKLHSQQGESRMRTHVWWQIQSRDLWIHEIGLRRLLWAL